MALAALQRRGLRIPGGLCVLTAAHDRFADTAGLRQAIALELGRKSFEDMRSLTVDGFLGIVVVGGTPPGTVVPGGQVTTQE